MGFETYQVFPAEMNLAFMRTINPRNDIEESGFPGSIRPDQPHNLPIIHVERDIRKDREPPEVLGDPFYLKKAGGFDSLMPSWCQPNPRDESLFEISENRKSL
jgi:hypothetical protein